MSYIKLTDGVPAPYTLAQLRADNPSVSFPRIPSIDILSAYGVAPCTPAASVPTYDPNVSRLSHEYEQVDGEWHEVWTVVPLTAEEKAANLDAWRGAASLTRGQFVLACFAAGLLDTQEAIEAARGGWPASFNAAVSGLPVEAAAAAQIEWATAVSVRRSSPLLEAVRAVAGVTPEQLDTMFGWYTD